MLRRLLLLAAFSFLFCSYSKAQYAFRQLYLLDSIGNSSSISKHFGSLYFHFLQNVESQMNGVDSQTLQLVRRFEQVFAQYYIDACELHLQNQGLQGVFWETYFADTSLQPVQYALLGANAHLNGGLWQALCKSFTQDEMESLKEQFYVFNRSLNKAYATVYKQAIRENKRVRDLRKITIGVDELAGKYFLYKWRKRQWRLAKYHWTGSPRFNVLNERVKKKKGRIDKLILRML